MLFGDAVKLSQMAFRLVPEVLYAVNVIPILNKSLTVADPNMMKRADVQHIVTAQRIRKDDAVRYDLLFQNAHQRRRTNVRNDLGVNPATTLQDPEYRNLTAGSPAAYAFSGRNTTCQLQSLLEKEWRPQPPG